MGEVLTAARPRRKNLLLRFFRIREIGALIPLILVIIITSIINKSFYSINNIVNMLRATSYIFIAGVGMTYVLCSRGLDLSVGSQMGLSGILLGILLVNLGWPIWISLIVTLIAGVIAGSFNGFLITGLRFPPFIATLATYYSYRGIIMGVTKGAPISPLPEAFKVIGLGRLFGIPYVIYFMAVLFVIATFVLRKTKYGRYVLAKGGNEESTRLAGINTNAITFSTYVLMGVLAFTAGIFFTSRFSSSQPNTGTGLELRVIAACIIGGVSLFGGSGSIAGTFVGSAFMVVLENAMSMARISGYWKMAILGVIIIIAIVIDLARKKELFGKE
jgi:ribose/xylose/arabinose/galactoside ABC-type transport system permease subunit